jgi:hypothetical protein
MNGLAKQFFGLPLDAGPHLSGQAHRSQGAEGVIAKGRLGNSPHQAELQVTPPAEGVYDVGKGLRVGHGNSDGINGEISLGEIRNYVVTLQPGKVNEEALAVLPSGHHSTRTALLVQEHKSASDSISHLAGQLYGIACHSEVNVVAGAAQQPIPHAAAYQVGFDGALLEESADLFYN